MKLSFVVFTVCAVILIGVCLYCLTPTNWECGPPTFIGYLTTIDRQLNSALIHLDNGREFVIEGYPDVTISDIINKKSDYNEKSDKVYLINGSGCVGDYVKFGDKNYWYRMLH